MVAYWTLTFLCYFFTGYQAVAGRFFFFMLSLVLVSYTATAMSLAISAGMDVVAVANLLITICFVLMLVSIYKAVCAPLVEVKKQLRQAEKTGLRQP